MSLPETEKPRIGIWMEFPTALGGERSMLAVLNALRDEFEFLVFAPPEGSLENELQQLKLKHVPVTVRDENNQRKPDAVLFTQLLQTLQQFPCDLLHVNSLTLGRFAGRFREQLPFSVTGHLRDIMKLSRKAISDLNQLDALIAVSHATAEHYGAQGLFPDRVEVIHNGISAQTTVPLPALSLREKLRLSRDSRLAITIGQIGMRKGHDLLVEAAGRLSEEFSNWHFLIVGDRYSGKEEARQFVWGLEQRIDASGLARRFHWLGYRDDVRSLLPQCDLLIHPARQEPFGRVLLEAAAAGIAIVATEVGGTSEMLTDGKEAILVPSEDVSSLLNVCKRIMNSGERRQELGLAAKGRMEAEFTMERASLAHQIFWRNCLQTP